MPHTTHTYTHALPHTHLSLSVPIRWRLLEALSVHTRPHAQKAAGETVTANFRMSSVSTTPTSPPL